MKKEGLRNPNANVEVAIIPAEANGWRVEIRHATKGTVIKTAWHKTKAEAMKAAKKMSGDLGISARSIKEAKDPTGKRENPRRNPHSEDMAKGACPYCGVSNLVSSHEVAINCGGCGRSLKVGGR